MGPAIGPFPPPGAFEVPLAPVRLAAESVGEVDGAFGSSLALPRL